MSQKYSPEFNPIQCTSEVFEKMTAQGKDGFLYFVTDTKQLYLGKDGKFVEMCGGLRIRYGIKEIEYDNTGMEPDPNVIFQKEELEDQELPLENDLILNIDGCFYKVISIDETGISTTRVTLQGSGIGPGGGGGSSSPTYRLMAVGGTSKIFSTTAKEMLIGFKPIYTGEEIDNYISYISCELDGAEYPFLEMPDTVVPFNKEKFIDLSPYMSLFSTIAQKSVKLKIKDTYGEEKSLTYKVKLVELSIDQTQNNIFYSLSSEYNYDCNVYGGLTLSNRRVIYSFYSQNNLNTAIKTIEYPTTIEGNVQKKLDLTSLDHGTYVLKVQAIGNIPGSSNSVSSNIITHKILYYDELNGSPIFSVFVPEVTEQFANIPITALLVTGGSSKEYTVEVKINNKLETQLKILSHTPLNYNLLFEEKGKYSLVITIIELNLSFSTILDITEYTGKLPIIDTNRDDLELYLNPRGKSNDSTDRNSWLNFNEKFSANLEDFYYGDINGWFIDEDGASYLRLSQGAKLMLPAEVYRPFAKNVMDPSNYGITIELDFKLNSVLDFNQDLIRCISTDQNDTIYAGFRITGNKAYLYTSIKNGQSSEAGDSPVTLNMVENERIKITYVIEKNKPQNDDFPMILTYLNGIISNATQYEESDRFVDAVSDGSHPAELYIDSTYGQIDLYGIRIYASALEQSVVLGNYQASLPTLEQREKSFKSNSILTNNKVDLRYMEDEDYDLGIPYIKITGGYKAADKKEMTMGTSGDRFGLPVGKKDFRLISFELKYPKTGYFAEKQYEDFKEICTFKSGKNETSLNPAYGETPETGAVMYAQGTSSLEYPVKNLRVKFKTKKVSVRPGMEPVDLICLKADFMESSGSHNTGAANFVDTVYKMSSMETPGQKFYSDEDIVTSIKGHPVAVFWSDSGTDGTYEYIGKYNFNLDKATPEPFGFKNTPEKYDPNAENSFGWDESGNNTIRCFEYLDNSVRVCNFLPKEGKTYEETWYELITDSTGATHYGWTEGFESRHPEDIVDEHGADCIYTMASWVNELYNLRQTDEKQALARFRNEYECYFNKDYLLGYYLITNLLLMVDSRTKNCMMASWGPEKDGFLGDENFKEKFYYPLKQENGEWVPDTELEQIKPGNYIWYPIFYDMDTMLGLDNQGHPRFTYYDEDTNPEVFNGDDILWNFVRDALPGEIASYYSRFESASSMFTTPTILTYFNNNQANLANEALYNGDAECKYIDTFREGYYDHLNTDAQGNPTFIEPGKSSRLYAAQGDRSLDRRYFVANRVNFMRGKYQSSNYQSGDRIEFRCYIPSGSGSNIEENNKINASIAEDVVPFNKTFNLTAIGPGFAGVRFGQNGQIFNYQFTTNNKTTTITTDQNPNDLECYILGLNVLSDVGDLSNKYLASFVIPASNKLKKLVLGNDHKNYYNPYWKAKQMKIDVSSCYLLEEFNMYNCGAYTKALDFDKCKQLQKLYLTGSGITSLTLPEGTVIKEMRLPDTIQTLKVKNQKFLEKFSFGYYDYGEDELHMVSDDRFINTYNNLRYAQILDTPIDSYELATKAADLQEYHFTNVNWIADKNDFQYCSLKEEDFDPASTYYKYISVYTPYNVYTFEAGLYQKNNDNYQFVREDSFEENIEYYKYNDQEDQYYLYFATSFEDDLYIINDFGEYQLVERGSFIPNIQYYKRNGTYEIYNTEVYEKGLYEKISLINKDKTITRIPILERLMRMGTINNINRADSLTGTLKIDLLCDDGTKPTVNEFDIYIRYNAIFPNLKIIYGDNIQGEKAYNIEFYRSDNYENIVNNLIKPDYIVQTNGKFSLSELTGENSPAGEALFVPAKTSTDEKVYNFTGYWVNVDDLTHKIHQDDFDEIIPFQNGLINNREVLRLSPEFSEDTRYYSITFYDDNGNQIEEPINYTYGETIRDHGGFPLLYCKLDNNDIIDSQTGKVNEHLRYTFKGWIRESDFINNVSNPSIFNIDEKIGIDGQKLYAYYVIEDSRYVPTNIEYFYFTNGSIKLEDEAKEYFDTILIENILAINIKSEYLNLLKGKITLPAKDANNNFIKTVGILRNSSANESNPNINYIYFEPNSQYESIGGSIKIESSSTKAIEGGFYGLTRLKEIYFNNNINTLKYLSSRSFFLCSDLVGTYLQAVCKVDFEDSPENMPKSTLPDTIEYIGLECFNSTRNIKLNKLPFSLKYVAGKAFYNCSSVNIEFFGNNEDGVSDALENNLEYIDYQAFAGAGRNLGIITFNKGLKYIGDLAFELYNGDSGIKLIDYSGLITEDAVSRIFGSNTQVDIQEVAQ